MRYLCCHVLPSLKKELYEKVKFVLINSVIWVFGVEPDGIFTKDFFQPNMLVKEDELFIADD